MVVVIWIGAALTLLGLAGLIWCILLALRAKRADLHDAAMKAALQRVVVINMAALALSGLGLMLVVIGVILA